MKSSIAICLSILLTMLIVDCSPTEVIETCGIITELNKSEIVIINPEKFDSFDQLVERVEEVVFNDSIPTISIKVDHVTKLVGLANPCLEGVVCSMISRRNVLKIQDEIIEMNTRVELDSIEEYISKHYNNHGSSAVFSESPTMAKISVTYDDLPMKGLKTLLSRIIVLCETIGLETPIIITLDRKIPPPPPKNDTNELRK